MGPLEDINQIAILVFEALACVANQGQWFTLICYQLGSFHANYIIFRNVGVCLSRMQPEGNH
jgi:hypothetical protein